MGAEGGRTNRLSSVRSTATPASTLPTVNETNILYALGLELLVCAWK